ncbi:Fungal Zn(2)-Cys(6) binuclear cluster domain [Ceratobasidium sp. AG-Ba]|nr:Fungal Zn(2)-Cys(6) binuclear cluster domain [Ceratobasidium sp. AG-Ba]
MPYPPILQVDLASSFTTSTSMGRLSTRTGSTRISASRRAQHAAPCERSELSDCRARGIVCNCPETRADDGSSPNSTAPVPPAAPAKGATTRARSSRSRKGRACLACRKLKMRCVAPNNGNENGNSNPDGPDERCQRCERAGLECIYVDRKRRGPGAVFGVQVDGANTLRWLVDGAFTNGQTQNPPTQNGTNPNSNQNTGPNVNGVLGAPNSPSQRPTGEKTQREGSPRNSSPYNGAAGQMMHGGEDAARTLEDSLGDDARRIGVRVEAV